MHYYKKKRSRSPIFSEGNKVYLLQKNIKTKQLSKKLDYTKLGPFKVKAVKRPLSYELELPPQMKIHPVFHVIYLEPANNNISFETNLPGIDPDNQEIKYEIKAILDQQEIDGQPRYLIKWKGYPHSNNTWELEDNLNYPTILSDFCRKNPRSENLNEEPEQASQSWNPGQTKMKQETLKTAPYY